MCKRWPTHNGEAGGVSHMCVDRPPEWEAKVQEGAETLVAMGFDKAAAVMALRRTRCDLEGAVEVMLSMGQD